MLKHFKFERRVLLYVVRMVLGCGIVWQTADWIHINQKVWALISVIIVSEPDFDAVRTTMKSRVINTLAGCAIGLVLIYVAGANEWTLISGVALAVIISTSFKKYPASWKLAPVTVVIVMIKSVMDKAGWKEAESLAIERTLEVLYGSSVAFILGWIASMFMMKPAPIITPVVIETEKAANKEGRN